MLRKIFSFLLCCALVTFGTKVSAEMCDPPAPYYAPPPICNPTPCPQPYPPPCSSPCAPCDPCAPVCGLDCGVSICAIAVAVLAVVGAAALVLAVGGHEHVH